MTPAFLNGRLASPPWPGAAGRRPKPTSSPLCAKAESLPHRPERAHTRRFYGQMLLERNGPGDRKQAEEVLRQAAEDYRRMGMPWHQELTASLVR